MSRSKINTGTDEKKREGGGKEGKEKKAEERKCGKRRGGRGGAGEEVEPVEDQSVWKDKRQGENKAKGLEEMKGSRHTHTHGGRGNLGKMLEA